MQVIKRDGRREPVQFDKVTARLHRLCDALRVDPALVTQKVASGFCDGMRVTQIDELAAETAAYMSTLHPDYSQLAARIAVSNLHRQTDAAFSAVVARLGDQLHDEIHTVVARHATTLDAAVVDERDFNFDYFGFKTLERAYLLRVDGAIVERPQHMLLRIALGIHADDLDAALETYELMSTGAFTHATPTMYNAGTPNPQMSSCFLLDMQSDSITGIFATVGACAEISKCAGGIGLAVSKVRAKDSRIRGSGGQSNGLVPMLRVFDATARYVDQGGGKRKGAFAIYLEPWHADVEDFLDLRRNQGKEEMRARDLFYALWVPDLFMRRVEANAEWTLFCPDHAPGLDETHGAAFDALYAQYEAEGRGRRTVAAQKLWAQICESQMEVGTPYILYKDACNAKSNQRHLGTIKCSNLCTEIVEFTSPDETAVCNLASIALPFCVHAAAFDFALLERLTRVLVRNLNRVIDRNHYPVESARRSNMRHRPIGIGVQGLADVFVRLRLPFDSTDARALNRHIFETIYYASVDESANLAARDGTYHSFAGSPASKGQLQFDLWDVAPSARYDWAALRARVVHTGLRNSLLVAPMPTASTAQILGNNECFEPFTSNLYTRRVAAGEFVVVNRHLLADLVERNLWDEQMRMAIMRGNGSVQHIDAVPPELKLLYRTCWEIPGKALVDMAADRGPFICQSQSFNVFMAEPSYARLTSMHFYGWRKGLKTGMYYLRSQPAADAIKFTVCDGDACTACSA